MAFRIGEQTKAWAEKSQLPVWYESQTTSTNSVAKEKSIAAEPVTLYLCDHQTAGRGRGDHTWTDPQEGGDALLSSWVFQMRRAPQPVLSPALGLAVWTTFQASFPWLDFSLKAPNDLYLGDKKIAGLLVENVQQGSHHRLIVGLGVNVWKWPAEIDTSTSLASRASQEITTESWMNVLDRLLLELSLAVSQTKEILSSSQRQGLLFALNRYPHLTEKYQKVDGDGSLWRAQEKIEWSDL